MLIRDSSMSRRMAMTTAHTGTQATMTLQTPMPATMQPPMGAIMTPMPPYLQVFPALCAASLCMNCTAEFLVHI